MYPITRITPRIPLPRAPRAALLPLIRLDREPVVLGLLPLDHKARVAPGQLLAAAAGRDGAWRAGAAGAGCDGSFFGVLGGRGDGFFFAEDQAEGGCCCGEGEQEGGEEGVEVHGRLLLLGGLFMELLLYFFLLLKDDGRTNVCIVLSTGEYQESKNEVVD